MTNSINDNIIIIICILLNIIMKCIENREIETGLF